MLVASVKVNWFPLSIAAEAKYGQESGCAKWLAIDTPPAEQPWIMTRERSPPKA
jgi:hypothetical protein